MGGSLSGGSVRILWDADDSAEVTITGGVSSWTVNGSAVTFPYTLSSSTTFETAHSGTYTVSVQHHGHEVANTPDGTREVELRFGEQAVFEPTVDDTGGGQWMADLHRELSATFARRKRGVLGSVGAVCFTWDDGFAAQDTIRQMADARGQRHTFAITSGLLGQTNRMTNAQVLAAYQNGHEISSHTVTHAAISDITLAERVAEYDNSKTALEAIIGVGKVKTFTYTYGSHKRTTTTDKELHLRYDRVLNTGSESGDSGSPYIYSRDELRPGATPWLIGRFPWTAANHQRVLALIRQAAVQPIVVVLYAHDPDTADDPTMAQVTEAMDLCESLGIDCLTTEEAFPAQSIVADPGFEDPTLAAWSVGKSAGGATNLAESVVDTPADGMPGTRSLHLTQNDAGGAGFTYVAQQVPVTPGVSYTLSFKYRSNTSGTSFTRPRARTRDYVGNVITQNQANLNNVQATWADGSLVFTADATAVSVSLEFIININTGEAWFDHVHFGPTRLGVLG